MKTALALCSEAGDVIVRPSNFRKLLAIGCIAAGIGFLQGAHARNAYLSNWAHNISEGMSAEVRGYPDSVPEVVVDGDTVHTLWFSRNEDWKQSVCYSRSTDGGETWEPIFEFYQNDAEFRDIVSSTDERHLAVQGDNVHIAFGGYGDGSSGWFGQLVYLRSTNGGATFEEPRVLWTTQGISNPYWHAQDVRLSADEERTVISYRRQRNWNDDYPYEFTAVVLISDDNGQNFQETAAATANNSWRLYDCFVDGDQMALQYYQSSYSYGYIQFGNMFMTVSGDGGETFTSTQISVPSSNGAHKALGAHDNHYSPVIAGANGRIYTAFFSLDENDQHAIFFRRTLDNGLTWGPALDLTAGTGITPDQLTSQFTLTAVNDEVYVLIHTSGSKLYLRKSTDGGESFGPLKEVSEGSGLLGSGAWWPVIKAIPGLSPEQTQLKIIAAGLTMFSSEDAGETFTVQAFGPRFSFRSADCPQAAIDANGAVHIVAEGVWTWYSTGVFGDDDTVYYRVDPQPVMSEVPGTAIQFTTHKNQGDGTGEERFDCMQVPSSPDILPQDAFTIEFWMKAEQSASPYGDHYPIVKEGPGKGGAWDAFLFGVWRSDQADARLTTDTDGYVLVGGPTLTPGQWFHLAATFDAHAAEKNFRMYVNGEEVATTNTQGLLQGSMAPLSIGGTKDRRAEGMVSLDEIRIWDHPRTAGEIQGSMNEGLQGPQTGLVAYYPMDGTPRDHSGNGNHGVFLYKEMSVPGAVATPDQPRITGSNIISGRSGESLNYQIITNFQPETFEVEGLPAGLVFDANTGVISGQPTAGGLFSTTVRAIGNGQSAEAALTISIEGGDDTIFTNHNIWGVQSGPSNPTEFTVDAPVLVTFVQNYHYFNNGTLPGTIALRHEDGTEYGPWQTVGKPGQGNVPNAYWECEPMVTIKAGKYQIIDSHPATWSHNSQSGYAGLSLVEGVSNGNAPQAVYDLWAENAGLSGMAADEDADPDQDDCPNWQEFGLGNDPLVADPIPVIEVTRDGSLAGLSVIQRKGGSGSASDYAVNGIGHRLEIATQLHPANWAPAANWFNQGAAEATDLGDGRERVTIPLADAPEPGETWFFRRVMTKNLE